uniref:Uncharacterized protein n=1 Tax=Arundo donax TaxID=35708 RepID=A0A0A8YKN9_ARUDO
MPSLIVETLKANKNWNIKLKYVVENYDTSH